MLNSNKSEDKKDKKVKEVKKESKPVEKKSKGFKIKYVGEGQCVLPYSEFSGKRYIDYNVKFNHGEVKEVNEKLFKRVTSKDWKGAKFEKV